jgi:heme/copper-type cytochrome/quinol oxidase subunit 3
MRPAVDVSKLPNFAFGYRAITWWGTLGIICIEGTMFALLFAAYLYLRGRSIEWPPGHQPPALLWGTLNTVVLALSAIPNQLTKKAAERRDLPKVKLWLLVCLVFGAAFSIIRIFEFRTLNVWWDANAYGSLIWLLIGFHTAHIVTDVLDTAVLTAAVFKAPFENSIFVAVSENALYWYFVLGLWVPVYVLIYVYTRF